MPITTSVSTPDHRPARSLSLHAPNRRMPAVRLRSMLAVLDEDELPDVYGRGGAVQRLEERIADLLAKDAAVLMPSGAMATQVALRLHADARGSRTVAFHPRAHVEVHENRGYAHVHGLHALLLGDHDRPVRTSDFDLVHEPVAAVLWELPQRDLGGALPSWDDLVAQTTWATDHGAARHLDGARLWEAQPFYDRPHAEIAALFDTVYVSLYKGLEGIAGAVLAGPAGTIDQARVWRDRLGGRVHQDWAVALTAQIGLDELLPRMREFWRRAQEIARAVVDVPGIEIVPAVPQTPLFHVHVHAPVEALESAHRDLIAERGVQLFLYARETGNPARGSFEVVVGENAMQLGVAEVADLLGDLVRRAQAVA